MYEEFLNVHEKIVIAKEIRAKSLDLSFTFSSELPEELFSLSDLEELNLNHSHVKDVSSLERLPNLKKLHLIGCSELQKFPILEQMALDFSWYFKFNIPSENICGLHVASSEVEKLVLQEFPNLIYLEVFSWGDLDSQEAMVLLEEICELEALQHLDFAGFGLAKIPECIGNLRNLNYLDLRGNNLSEFPESICGMERLTHLYLGSNELRKLPKSIGSLKTLISLDIEGNQLEKLPESIYRLESLVYLHLGMNQITELPKSFCKLKSLKELEGNFNQLAKLLIFFNY